MYRKLRHCSELLSRPCEKNDYGCVTTLIRRLSTDVVMSVLQGYLSRGLEMIEPRGLGH